MALEMTLKRPKKAVYPTKNTINLVACDEKPVRTKRDIIIFVVAMVAVLLFAKFGVVDVMGSAMSASSKVASAQAQLTALQQGNADYSKLQEQYATYTVNSLSDDEKSLTDRAAILNLLQDSVASSANLKSVTISANTVLLQFSNTSLQDVSNVVDSLDKNPLVSNVAMSTAKTDKNDDVVSTVTITLNSQN